MEIIGKISKGSRMDQIYIPKKRVGFDIGKYVIITLLDGKPKKSEEKLSFYNIESIEPIKLKVVREIINILNRSVENENIIITGSFLDKGFHFNDIDIILISNEKINPRNIEKSIEDKIKIKTHILLLNNKTLTKGLSTDPLYQVMLSKCIAKKRFIYRVKQKINYKILDLHLLKSKTLIDNFDIINGNEKYYLVRNMTAIYLYLKKKKITKDSVDKEITKQFNINIEKIRQNVAEKKDFIKKYKYLYQKTFNKIMREVKLMDKNGK